MGELSVAQQRKRTASCKECRGWGFVPGHVPMKICDCIVPTDHSRFSPGAPAGVTIDASSDGAAVTKKDRERRAGGFGAG